MTINNKTVIIIYYLAFSVSVLVFSFARPRFNWDCIAYIASAKSFETADIQKIHSFAYDQIKKVVPPSRFEKLIGTEGSYRSLMFKDATAFYKELSFYKIKLLYVIMVFLLYKVGFDIVFATYFISGISVFISIWIIFLICKELRLASPFIYVLPPLALSYGILSLVTSSTPDGLNFLVFILCVYLFIKKQFSMFVVIPLLAAIRTDMILFSGPFLVYLIIFGKNRKGVAVLALIATLMVYWFVNWYCKNPEMRVLFYSTFIGGTYPPTSSVVGITIKQYFMVLINGIKQGALQNSVLIFLVVSGFFTYFSIARARYNKLTTAEYLETNILVVFSFLYVVIHFMLLPAMRERYFVGQYLVVTIYLFEILSKGMVFKLYEANKMKNSMEK